MSDKTTITTIKGFFNAKTITQLIVVIIISILAIVFLVRNDKQDRETIDEWKKANANVESLLKEMISNQANVDTLIRCVNRAHKDAADTFDQDFTIILGETLANAGMMQFPQKLNQAFMRFKGKFGFVKDCLIFPEDLK